MTPAAVARLQTIDRTALGARIRSYRLARRLSQRDLVEHAGVTAAYLSRIETGDRRPSVAVLECVAKTLRVDVDQLVGEPACDAAPSRVPTAHIVAVAASRWLGSSDDVGAYADLVAAVRRWEEELSAG